ncbi:aprataxin and PNK-like factor [Oryzias melastigma]|uniref:aprataxin and PNK-like factor n=1 Tax=Oryzias melastigma TaxID=30732 RepID=UPI000CF80C96|nr:aprataxin and PNK-like factor [Oryzias melastigma]
MSGFLLVPLDGGDPVPVPPGETQLGRGPLLRISDKRVSRHHGLLQNLNGELRLKPTHVNPCFVQASASSEPRPLPKGCWYMLRDGELFSLLPERLVFRVEAVGGQESTHRSSRSSEDEQLPASSEQHGDISASDSQEREEPDGGSRQTSIEPHRDAAPSEVRVRILPAWMMAVAAQSPALTLKVQSAVHRRKRPAGGVQATPTSASLPEEAGPKEGEAQRKMDAEEAQRKKRKREEEEEERKKRKREEEEERAPKRVVPAGASSLSPWSDPTRPQVKNAPRRLAVSADDLGCSSTEALEVNQPQDMNTPALAPPTTQRRKPCPYGKDCYRKNPLHFQESSHPGDSDYEEEEEEEEEEEDRPECPYGTDCYRKNPLHRREYKHTKKPARSTRAVPRNAPDEEEDEDSFIDDDSEDPDNDSDYNPAPSDDSDGEDIKRQQREATAFLKKRK